MILDLDPADLATSLTAARDALQASPAGTAHEWRLPPAADGPIVLDAPLVIDTGGRALVLRGIDGRPRLEVDAGAAAAGVILTGRDVTLRGLDVAVTGDNVVAVALTGSARAALVDCTLGVAGRDVAAAVVASDRLAEVVDVAVRTATATVGDAAGVVAQAPRVRVHRTRVRNVVAAGHAVGVRAGRDDDGVEAGTLSGVTVAGVTGDSATGLHARAGAAGPADDAAAGPDVVSLTLLDVAASAVRARAGGATARGIDAASAGALDVRGVAVRDVDGPEAVALRLLAGGAARVSGAVVDTVAGGAGGAAGVQLAASASWQPLTVEEAHVEHVHAVGDADLVRGIAVLAPVSELAPWVDDATPPGALEVTGCVLRRISGTALHVDADLRDVAVRGVEVYAAAVAGELRGERVIISETTAHRLQRGLMLGPCVLTLVSALLTRVAEGPALVLGAESETGLVRAVYADPADPTPLLRPLPNELLPYVNAGPDGVPAALGEGRSLPASAVDLRLAPPAALHDEAVATPADPPERRPHLGAHPPRLPAQCDLRDPLEAPPEPLPAVAPPGPVVDRLARDGRALLGVMQARAAEALPGWVPGDPADLTTTLLELLAHRLDRISHRQDAALAEASLASARLRRSVEAHARLVDYQPDPGLSATTMIELRVPDSSLVPLGLAAAAEVGLPAPHVQPFILAADSVVVNGDAAEAPVIVSTEQDLVWHHSLQEVALAAPVERGATHAELRGDLADLTPGRWLVLQPHDPRQAPHVVMATMVERGASTTLVRWDPRRPAPSQIPLPARVLANVVPAHHGVRIAHRVEAVMVEEGLAAQFAALQPTLDLLVDTRPDAPVEIPLPLAAVSRIGPGWPFPGKEHRSGEVQVAVEVDGEPWRLVADVASEPGEVVMVVPDAEGGSVLRLGQPGAFTGRPVHVTVTAARVGVGQIGNVGPHTLSSLLALGPGSTVTPAEIGMDLLRRLITIDNPVPGLGGRDPEPLEHIRHAAPWTARAVQTAVTRRDYEALLIALPEVAGARARVEELGERRLVRATLLLADEDTLVAPAASAAERGDVDLIRDAERLRRWGLARRRLEDIRLLGFDVSLVPPTFVPLDIDVIVDAAAWASADQVHKQVTAAIASSRGLLDPDETGLGGDVHVDAILGRVLAVGGVESARVRRLRRLQPGAAEHAVDGTLPVGEEEVAIIHRPYGDGADGVLTVEVCGGVR